MTRLYIYGGIDIKEGALGDIHYIDLSLENLQWKKIDLKGNAPKHLYRHTGNLIGESYFVFGGITNMLPVNTIMKINTNTLELEDLNPSGSLVPKMDSHSSVNLKNFVYIFGGYMNYVKSNETYRFDTSNNAWEFYKTKGKLPQKRSNHSSILYQDNMYIFAGSNEINDKLSDLWFLNLNTKEWREIHIKEAIKVK